MYSPNITIVVRSRRVSRTENLKGSDFLGDIDEYGRINTKLDLSVIDCVDVGVAFVNTVTQRLVL
jgi:hypothetical protein